MFIVMGIMTFSKIHKLIILITTIILYWGIYFIFKYISIKKGYLEKIKVKINEHH